MATQPKYDGSQIKVLRGLEAVRKRPGMYIGDTGLKGLHHCIWEIVDNSVDEHMAGHANEIHVTIHKDFSISIADNGRGIPVDIHPEEKIPTATVVMTVLHAGGKFENESGESAYKTSGGLHGVGASVVNALSSRFEMAIQRDGKVYEQAFANGGIPEAPLKPTGKSSSTGTRIRFWPDMTIFRAEDGDGEMAFRQDIIARSLTTRAHLNPGLRITLKDERDGFSKDWLAESFAEILDVISDNRSAPVLPTLTATQSVETHNGEVDVAIAFRVHSERAHVLASYANNIVTPQGGAHDAGFRSAILRAYNRYAELNKLTKEPFIAEDVREGLVAAVSVKLAAARFSGQTKDKLANGEANGAVSNVTYQTIMRFFEENPKNARNAIARAERAARARVAAEKARDTVERKNPLQIGTLPGKLADCQSTDPEECELYLVEGDSAGGSAKQGRDRRTQAILPLKGKPQNVLRKDDIGNALSSEEINNIVQVLGCGVGPSFDIEKLRYKKLILMTDADVDGAHIITLLLTLIRCYMPELIRQGHVYLAMPPLYRVLKGKSDGIWIQDDEALEAFFEANGRAGYSVQRFKGLGEMNPGQLWETTMDPQTRSLIQLHYSPDPVDLIENNGEPTDDAVFQILMGNEVPPRRAFIEKNATYAQIDT